MKRSVDFESMPQIKPERGCKRSVQSECWVCVNFLMISLQATATIQTFDLDRHVVLRQEELYSSKKLPAKLQHSLLRTALHIPPQIFAHFALAYIVWPVSVLLQLCAATVPNLRRVNNCQPNSMNASSSISAMAPAFNSSLGPVAEARSSDLTEMDVLASSLIQIFHEEIKA